MSDDFAALERSLTTRYSCRAFKPDPVPDAVIEQIVRAAGHAASWCNAQPWLATITRGDETARFRDALLAHQASASPAADLPWPKGYPGATGARRRTCGFQLYGALGIEREDYAARQDQHLENYRLFGAPHVAIISSEADLGPYGALDCGGFVTAFMLAATSLGVNTIAQASVAAYPDFIRTHFGLPDTRLILCAISFGFEDPDHPANSFRTERAELGDIYDPRG